MFTFSRKVVQENTPTSFTADRKLSSDISAYDPYDGSRRRLFAFLLLLKMILVAQCCSLGFMNLTDMNVSAGIPTFAYVCPYS